MNCNLHHPTAAWQSRGWTGLMVIFFKKSQFIIWNKRPSLKAIRWQGPDVLERRLPFIVPRSLVLEWHLIKVRHSVQYHVFGVRGRPAKPAPCLLPANVGPFPQETTRALLCFLKYSNRICSLDRKNARFSSASICWACRLLSPGVGEMWTEEALRIGRFQKMWSANTWKWERCVQLAALSEPKSTVTRLFSSSPWKL